MGGLLVWFRFCTEEIRVNKIKLTSVYIGVLTPFKKNFKVKGQKKYQAVPLGKLLFSIKRLKQNRFKIDNSEFAFPTMMTDSRLILFLGLENKYSSFFIYFT